MTKRSTRSVKTRQDVLKLVPSLNLSKDEGQKLVKFVRSLPEDAIETAFEQLVEVRGGGKTLDEAVAAIELLIEEPETILEVTAEMPVAEVVKILKNAGARLTYRQRRKLDDLALGGQLPEWAVDVINNHIRQIDTPDGGKAGEMITLTRSLFLSLRLREVVNFDELRELNFLGGIWWILRSIWSVFGLIPYGRTALLILVVLFLVLPQVGGPLLGFVFSSGLNLIWGLVGRFVMIGLVAAVIAVISLVVIRPWMAARQAIARLANCVGWDRLRVENDPEHALSFLREMTWVGETSLRAALGLSKGGKQLAAGAGRAWGSLLGRDVDLEAKQAQLKPFMQQPEVEDFRRVLQDIGQAQEKPNLQVVRFGYEVMAKSFERVAEEYQKQFELPHTQQERFEAFWPYVVRDLEVLVYDLNRYYPDEVDILSIVNRWLETPSVV